MDDYGPSALAAALAVLFVACAPGLPEAGDDYELIESSEGTRAAGESAGEAIASEEEPAAAKDPEPDAGSAAACEVLPPSNKCGLSPQCGCSANETCAVTAQATGATSCITAGSARLGHACTSTGDCELGLACTRGACRPYCTTGNACPLEGTKGCFSHADPDGKPYPNSSFCAVTCDLLDPSVCGTNTCIRVGDVTDCRAPGPKGAGEACTSTGDCRRGLLCIGGTCAKWCRIGVAGDCGTGVICTKMGGAPVVDGKEYGYCAR